MSRMHDRLSRPSRRCRVGSRAGRRAAGGAVGLGGMGGSGRAHDARPAFQCAFRQRATPVRKMHPATSRRRPVGAGRFPHLASRTPSFDVVRRRLSALWPGRNPRVRPRSPSSCTGKRATLVRCGAGTKRDAPRCSDHCGGARRGGSSTKETWIAKPIPRETTLEHIAVWGSSAGSHRSKRPEATSMERAC